MLALSMTVNPECEHIEGDMRTLRLGHTFDAVFLHDAVMYLTLCCSTRPEGFERAWTTTVQAGGRPARRGLRVEIRLSCKGAAG